ncbi:thiamine-phosphate kinase [Comamonas serinivorans]|uniref:Thiamine-monophosphate kinase n=1 Tax=Comamonas serinivorans TaxID=1082851 RepID=A0A1Y0EK72_9BURK|nr:thiamine-phosphate kinase [Comamonas serinivorans]ARU04044.1 thiamine-phosphate kinase [Comamonas serinivorans]
MGEFDLIDRFFRQPAAARLAGHAQVTLGIGDDCALLAPRPGLQLAVTSDMLVAGRHFFADAEPEALGHKCLAVNLSDLAAMGARPLGFTLALALPRVEADWLQAFSRGMLALADASACPLVGGDTTAGPLTIAITALGEVPAHQALRRDGARVGDDIWVSGSPGDARLGLALRRDELRLPPGHQALADLACARMDRPTPRLALGLALSGTLPASRASSGADADVDPAVPSPSRPPMAQGLAHSAADVSDGLLADLGHILAASGVGAEVHADAVLQPSATWGVLLAQGLVTAEQAHQGVLAGGDDYELVFTAAPAQAGVLQTLSHRLGLPLTRIGRITAEVGLRVRDAQGQVLTHGFAGFDHFA